MEALPGAIAHPLPQRGIDNQRADGAREILDVMRLGHEAVRFVVHQLFGPAGVGDDDRHARCLRFDDDVAEGVCGAWKSEDISRGVGGGEFEAGEITGEDCIRESLGKRLRVRSMADDEKLDRQSLLAETAVCICQNIEIFLA